jgi:hypothetical protein
MFTALLPERPIHDMGHAIHEVIVVVWALWAAPQHGNWRGWEQTFLGSTAINRRMNLVHLLAKPG